MKTIMIVTLIIFVVGFIVWAAVTEAGEEHED